MRSIRNFWLEATIDGRKSPLVGGPRSAHGGFELVIKIRENGAISSKSLLVYGMATQDGKLTLQCRLDEEDKGTLDSFQLVTDRNATKAKVQAVHRG